MKRPRIKTITRRQIPKGSLADCPLNDAVRRVISPANITFINGTMMLTKDGIRELTAAVADGRIPGDPAKSRRLLAFINESFPS